MSRKPLHTTKSHALLQKTFGHQDISQAHRDYLDFTVAVYCRCDVSGGDGKLYIVVVSMFEDYDGFHQDLRNIFRLHGSPLSTQIEALTEDDTSESKTFTNLSFVGCAMIPCLRLVKQRGGRNCCFILKSLEAK